MRKRPQMKFPATWFEPDIFLVDAKVVRQIRPDLIPDDWEGTVELQRGKEPKLLK